jgi:hypothetical protein
LPLAPMLGLCVVVFCVLRLCFLALADFGLVPGRAHDADNAAEQMQGKQ